MLPRESQSSMNALCRVACLLDPGFVLFEDIVDDPSEGIQLDARINPQLATAKNA